MTGGARGRLVSIRRLAFIWMVLPELRIGGMTTPTRLPRSFLIDPNVFGTRGHSGRLSAYDPQDGKQGEDANGDA